MLHEFIYTPTGACCTRIAIRLEGDLINDVMFTDGCRGNHQGLSALVKGHNARDVVGKLSGIQCRNGTSCPDQLSRALAAALASPR